MKVCLKLNYPGVYAVHSVCSGVILNQWLHDRNSGEEVIHHFYITLVHRVRTQCTTWISQQINNLADPDNKVVEMALVLQAVIDLQHIELG